MKPAVALGWALLLVGIALASYEWVFPSVSCPKFPQSLYLSETLPAHNHGNRHGVDRRVSHSEEASLCSWLAFWMIVSHLLAPSTVIPAASAAEVEGRHPPRRQGPSALYFEVAAVLRTQCSLSRLT